MFFLCIQSSNPKSRFSGVMYFYIRVKPTKALGGLLLFYQYIKSFLDSLILNYSQFFKDNYYIAVFCGLCKRDYGSLIAT